MSPASRSTLRWWEMVGPETSKSPPVMSQPQPDRVAQRLEHARQVHRVFGVERRLGDRRAARRAGRVEHHELFRHASRLTDFETACKLSFGALIRRVSRQAFAWRSVESRPILTIEITEITEITRSTR